MRLGPVALCGIPGEPFSQTGREIKAAPGWALSLPVLERTGAVKKGNPSPIELYIAQSEHAYGPTLARAALSLFSRSLLGRDTSDETLKDFRFEPLPSQRGSVATLSRCVQNMVKADVPVDQAVRMASENPARRIGANRKGRIEAGMDADLVLLAADLQPVWVMARGRVLKDCPGRPLGD